MRCDANHTRNPPGQHLSAETVKGTALTLQGVDDVQAGDGLALGVFGVGDGVADDGLEEGFEHAAGFFVDHWWGGKEEGAVSGV